MSLYVSSSWSVSLPPAYNPRPVGFSSTWWRYQMETFSALLAHSPVSSPHKGQWRGYLMFFLICVWINGWVNSREAGDLRRHRAHYDVIVMSVVILYTAVDSHPSVNMNKLFICPAPKKIHIFLSSAITKTTPRARFSENVFVLSWCDTIFIIMVFHVCVFHYGPIISSYYFCGLLTLVKTTWCCLLWFFSVYLGSK